MGIEATRKEVGQVDDGTQATADEAATEETEVPRDPDAEFEAQQAQQAASQNAAGGVPEERPIASQQRDASFESETHRKVAEAGEDGAMDREAHEKADSDAQRKKAAKQERQPNLLEGTRCVVDDTDSPHHGRSVFVTSVNYADDTARMIAQSGTAEARAFADVRSYTVKTRDGRVEEFELDREQIKLVPDEQWGRGRF